MNAAVVRKITLLMQALGMIGLAVATLVLAATGTSVKILYSLFFAAKALFDLFLYQRAVLLYRGVHRPMGKIGVVISILVSAAVTCSVVQLALPAVRRWLYAHPPKSNGLDTPTLTISATVIVDVGVVVAAVKLYVTPIEDAVHVARAAGLQTEVVRFREVLTRHLALCALAVISSCWTWSALVFVPVPALCLCSFFAWWYNLRSRGSRLDALDAIAALVLRDSWALGHMNHETTPRTPGQIAARASAQFFSIKKALAAFLLAGLLGLAVPIAIAHYISNRSLLARAPFLVWDTVNHAILVILFLQKHLGRKAPHLPTVRDITPSRHNSDDRPISMPRGASGQAFHQADDVAQAGTTPGGAVMMTAPSGHLSAIVEETTSSNKSKSSHEMALSNGSSAHPQANNGHNSLATTKGEEDRYQHDLPPVPRRLHFDEAADNNLNKKQPPANDDELPRHNHGGSELV